MLNGNPAQLMGSESLSRMRSLCANFRTRQPAIFIAPAPVFGIEILESLQDLVSRGTGSYELDLEHWHANPDSLIGFMSEVLRLQPNPCVILSGDVHYAFEATGEVGGPQETVRTHQFTSSATKNRGTRALAGIGHLQTYSSLLNHVRHPFGNHTHYWRQPDGTSWILNLNSYYDLAQLPYVLARFRRQADFRESMEFRRLLDISGGFNTMLYENNIGEIRVNGSNVTHRLHYTESSGRFASTQEHRF
jgi:hypothetical protein